MSGKQITELESAEILDEGDLMLIRKSSMGKDQSLSRAKLIESIGNSAVSGYTAKSNEDDRITLAASNNALIPKYYEGMKISFISPINTRDIVKVKIGTLPYVELQKYFAEESVKLVQHEYIEAVYSNGLFKQTNNLNTHLVWSNEYIAEAEINAESTVTTYNLTSAIGAKKPHYYTGMSLLFNVPVTSKGSIFVNVDGLGVKKLGEPGNSPIAKDIYEAQAIMAIYDGKEFIKQKFSTIHHTPIIPEEEEAKANAPSSNSVETPTLDTPLPIKHDDIWAEDHPGDLDDPANTTSPHATDSKGFPMFDKIITVGENGMYKHLVQAFYSLINEYGADGGGLKFAIELDSSYKAISKHYGNYASQNFSANKRDADFRWITIFSKNNRILDFTNVSFGLNCKYSPIINFKMTSNCNQCLFKANSNATLVFGRNAEIHSYATPPFTFIHTNRIEARYGITIKTNGTILCLNLLMNKGIITYTPSSEKKATSGNKYCFLQLMSEAQSKIYNTKFFLDYKTTSMTSRAWEQNALVQLLWKNNKIFMRNVQSTDRKGKMSFLHVPRACCGYRLELEDCNLTSETQGGHENGYDILIDIKPIDSKIILKNTTGNTNLPEAKRDGDRIIPKES